MNNITVDYQLSVDNTTQTLPTEEQLSLWVQTALTGSDSTMETAEITIRVVNREEGQALNKAYRDRDYATNVLSFPFESPVQLPIPLLGDLVICAEVVAEEAKQQQKAVIDHWTHMVIHGTLHLLGYDHIEDDEAEVMEQLETQLLASLNIPDPYQVSTDTEHNA